MLKRLIDATEIAYKVVFECLTMFVIADLRVALLSLALEIYSGYTNWVHHVQLNDARTIFAHRFYKLQACCITTKSLSRVMKGRVQVFWEAELLLRAKFTF